MTMPHRDHYPQHLADVLDPPVRFKRQTLAALRRFARSKPWQGSQDEREAKLRAFHGDLSAVYAKTTALWFGILDGTDSGSSFYSLSRNEIVLSGRISVVTYLHEFAHALGKDEREAVRWSVNLFRRCFPRSFSRSIAQAHMVRRPAGPA